MIKLKDILYEDVSLFSIDVVLVTDKNTNFTNVVDGVRGIRKVTTVNVNTSDELEDKNRKRTDDKEVHTATIKFIGGQDPKQDLEFFKTTMLQSKKGDPNKRIEGLRHVIFKPDTLTRI
jgi:ketopantoate reductase